MSTSESPTRKFPRWAVVLIVAVVVAVVAGFIVPPLLGSPDLAGLLTAIRGK